MAEIINLEANKALVRRFFQDFDSVGLQEALDNNAGTDVVVHNPALSREPLSGAAWAVMVFIPSCAAPSIPTKERPPGTASCSGAEPLRTHLF